MVVKKPESPYLKELGERQFTKYTWYIWVCIIAVGGLINLTSILWARWRRRHYASTTSSATTIKKGVVSTTRIPAAILAASRIAAFRLRIPSVNMTLLEVLLMCLYIIVLAILNYTYTNGLDVATWTNRAGHMAAIQFPLIVALSGKNNTIGIITGLSHEKLNLLHRAVSRVIMCLVWLHCAGTYMHWQTGAHRNERWWIYASWIVAGLLSCIAQTFLVFFSFEPIRRRYYEFFYSVHMALVIVILVCAMYHIHTSDHNFNLNASPYFWPSFLVWGVDRGFRLLRVLLLNSIFKPQKDSGHVELITPDTLLFTTKRHVPAGLRWLPGQHMFVSFPTLGPGQSHPFTISSIAEKGTKEQELVFLARIRKGFTRRLKDHVLEAGPCDVPIILDGPYGVPADITPFSTCVFVAGGSGVTFTLPRFQYLVNELNDGKACARRIAFIWAIRDRAHMRWISNRLAEIAALAPSNVSLSISIFVTSRAGAPVAELTDGTTTPANESDDVEKKGDSSSSEENSEMDEKIDRISVFEGRPDIPKLLEEEVSSSEGPVSVDVSGPKSLLATTRSTLSSGSAGPLSVLKGAPTVQLNVEAFAF